MDAGRLMPAGLDRLVLLVQGNDDPRWQRPFVQTWLKLQDELGPNRVSLAFLEGAGPSLLALAREAVEENVSGLIILPLFLALGNQIEQEIPRQVVSVKERYPDLGIVLLPPIGEHPAVIKAIHEVAKASCEMSLPLLPS